MGQRRGERSLVEVVGTRIDEVPVGHIEQRGQTVAAQGRVGAGRHQEGGEEGNPHQHEKETGQQATGPADPESGQTDGTRALMLGDEQ